MVFVTCHPCQDVSDYPFFFRKLFLIPPPSSILLIILSTAEWNGWTFLKEILTTHWLCILNWTSFPACCVAVFLISFRKSSSWYSPSLYQSTPLSNLFRKGARNIKRILQASETIIVLPLCWTDSFAGSRILCYNNFPQKLQNIAPLSNYLLLLKKILIRV